MRIQKGFIKILAVILIAVFTLFPGCGQQEGKKNQDGQQMGTQQQSDKIPEQLEEIEKSIEKIIKALDGPSAAEEEEKEEEKQKKSPEQQDTKQESQDKEGEQGGNESEKKGEGGQKSEQGQQEDGAKQDEQKEAQKDPWKEIIPAANDLHYKWNSFMPMAVKKGAGNELIDNFSDGLNSLTSTAISKNRTNTLMACSYLYGYIPDLYSLYKTPMSPEIKRIRYYIRNAMLNAMTANWEQAESDMENLKSSWSLYKNAIPQKQLEDANRLDFSIFELEKVIGKKDQPLSDIKGRVAMSNVGTLEKALEKSQAQSGGSQQSEDGQQSEEEQQ
jgi:hypothetical protein